MNQFISKAQKGSSPIQHGVQYAADGRKLRTGVLVTAVKSTSAGVVTLMEYEGNEVIENGKLRMLLFDSGYVDFSGSEPRYCWYTKDHLESIRTVALYMCDTTLLSRTDTATVCLYVDGAGYIQGSIKGAAYIKDCVYWYGNSTYAEILCDFSVEREDSLAFPDMLDGLYRRKIIKTLN